MQDIIEKLLSPNPSDRPSVAEIIAYPELFPTLYRLTAELGCLNLETK